MYMYRQGNACMYDGYTMRWLTIKNEVFQIHLFGALCVMNAKLPYKGCSVTPAEVLPCTQKCLIYTFECKGCSVTPGVFSHTS